MPALSLTKRSFTALALATLLGACAAPAGAPPAATAAQPRPKLLVFLVVDGLPMRQVTGYRDQLQPDGFARFLDRGTWFADAHYGYAYTVTAAGHATMLTGAYPHASGIIGNDWRDVASGESVYCTGDTRYTYIGHKTAKLDGTSPANLRAETVGDVLRRATPQSKVIAISGKDRGAILPGGHAGTAYMYMSETGFFASSTYYMPAHPAWVEAFNAARPADRYFKAEWKPALADADYARSLGDNQPWFGTRPGKLPMTMGAALERPAPAFYASLLRSPFVDEMSLAFARAAVAGERLGQRDATDILSVSLSGHDYVNHYWSAESRLSHDHFLHLDRLLQAFFRDLDASVGKDHYIAVLTADHGFMPAPEVSRMRGLDAGRQSGSEMLGRVNTELEKRFGVPKLGRFFSASALVIDRALLAQKNLDLATVAEAARATLAAEPAVVAAYTRQELDSGSRAGAPFFDAMRKSWHRERSGDVQYALKPNWMFQSSSSNATHGSPHPYDTHVPILMYGPAWLKAARVDRRVETADLAPTLARLLGVAVPASAEGRPLPLP
jgi:predicted AlkP superfamily pyrophosphatase or phosphodiesterase